MNLDTALRLNAAAMAAARHRLNVASTNLANAETTRTEGGGPFRRRMLIQRAEILKDEGGYPIGRHEAPPQATLGTPRATRDTPQATRGTLSVDMRHPIRRNEAHSWTK